VLTIGHSTHEHEAFAQLVAAHAVDLVVDVRRHPRSRRVPWTNPGVIERALPVDYEELRARGVEFTEEPTEHFYGIDCGLRDPFGNHLRLTQPAEDDVVPDDPGAEFAGS